MAEETPAQPVIHSNVVDWPASRRPGASAGPSEDPLPTVSDSGADTPPKGNGGKQKRPIDWGKYTHLVENFVLVYPTDTAWDCSKRKLVKIANMAHMFGADYVRMWKTSPDRRTVDEEDLVFDPTMTCSSEAINLYDGFAIEPVPCDAEECDPMLRLLEHLCSQCVEAPGYAGVSTVMDWVLKWLALPLQRPGAKPRSALVFHGPQGTGKNLFFDVMQAVYGKYAVMVGQTEIEEKYNGWLSAKLLVIGNEVVSRQELWHNKNRLKWVITEDRIPIRTMHTDTRWEKNHANVIFLSNERQPIVLEIGDRRYLVVYTPMPEDPVMYKAVRDFLASGGAAKWFHFLLHYPLGDFDEHTKPPMTEAKEELVALGMKPAERFMVDWTSGFLDLPLQVCSSEQLYRAFRRWCDESGERWPPYREVFTTDVRRWAKERVERDSAGRRLPPIFDYKVCTLPPDPLGSRKSVRTWIPRGAGPLPGVTEGAWAKDAIDAFEQHVHRYTRGRSFGDDSPPSPKGVKNGGGGSDA